MAPGASLFQMYPVPAPSTKSQNGECDELCHREYAGDHSANNPERVHAASCAREKERRCGPLSLTTLSKETPFDSCTVNSDFTESHDVLLFRSKEQL